MTLVSIPADVATLASAEVTTRELNPPWTPRRPFATGKPVTNPFSIVGAPVETAELPAFAQYAIAAGPKPAVLDEADRRPRWYSGGRRRPLEAWQILIIGAGIGGTVHHVAAAFVWLAFGGLG